MSLTSHGSHAAPRRPDGRALATGGIIFGIGLLIITGLMAILLTSASAAPLLPTAHSASSQVTRAAPAATVVTPASVLRIHSQVTVRSGDTLSRISQREYGQYRCWPGVYRTNQRVIGGNPDFIQVGQRLVIPVGCSTAVPAVTTSVVTQHTPSPAPVPSSGGGGSYGTVLTFSQIEQLWVSADGPSWAEYRAAAIAECESGGNRYAYNPSGASGIWQILGSVVSGDLFNPYVNALNAVSKFRASGDTFAQWVCQA